MTNAEKIAIEKHFFDAHASNWEDWNYSSHKLEQTDELLKRVVIPKGATVLDVGCGQGILLPILREKIGSSGHLLALDNSAAMLRHAAKRQPDAVMLLSDVHTIPLPDNYVGAITCFSAFPHFQDKEAVAREFHRVLVPGGKVWILHIDGRETLAKMHNQYEPVAGDVLPCPKGMRKIFSNAGFNNMACDESSEHYYFEAIKEETTCD